MDKIHGLKRHFPGSFDEAIAAIPLALKSQGFGILTEIDVQSTLKAKLGADFRRYRILGACNPPFALQALEADIDAGLMLPCNVIVYEGDDGGVVIMAVDPNATVASTGNPSLVALAGTVREKLLLALDALV